MVPLTSVRLRYPKRGHRASIQRRGRVDRLTGSNSREPPPGPGSQVARALGDHGHICPQDEMRREEPVVHGNCLQIAPEGLSNGDRASQPPGIAQTVDSPRERQGERTPIGGDVGHRCSRPDLAQSRDDRRQRGVEVGDNDRHAVEVAGISQELVVRRVLLVHPQNCHLQRGVAGLHQMSRTRGVLGQPVRDAGDQCIPARAQVEVEGRDVQQDDVVHHRLADDVDVGKCPDGQFRG